MLGVLIRSLALINGSCSHAPLLQMAQENNESRSKSEKRRRVSLPWPVARKSEVVKVSYETKGEGKETADGAAVLVKPRSTSDEADISTRAPPIAPAPPNPDSVVS